jgi:hypothetical protein
MLRFLTDENFDGRFLRAMVRENAMLDIVRAQDTEIYQADDPTLLEWAAQNGRIVLTHDVNTMTHFAYERVRAGKAMPGVFEVDSDAPIARVVEDILLHAEASEPDELEGLVTYIPLK